MSMSKFDTSLTENSENSLLVPDRTPYYGELHYRLIKCRQIAVRFETLRLENSIADLNDVKALFALIKEGEYLDRELENFNQRPESNSRARLVVTNIAFNTIDRAAIGNKFFVLLIGPNSVQTSKFVTTTVDYVVFDDIFIFNNCSIDFQIEVQLYSVKLSAQIKHLMKKVMPYVPLQLAANNFRCFEFVQKSTINRSHLQLMHRLKMVAVYTDEVYLTRRRHGYLELIDNDSTLKRCCCQLIDTQLKVIVEHRVDQLRYLMFDLRYSGFAEIRDGVLIFKTVRQRNQNEVGSMPLKSDPRFILTFYRFIGNDIVAWRKEINEIVEILNEWKFSFLRVEELYF